MKPDFVDLQEKLESKRNIQIIYGGVMQEIPTLTEEYVDPLEAFKKDPFTKFKQWVENAGYRLIDVLRHFDKDNSLTISRQEFTTGIEVPRMKRLLEHKIWLIIIVLCSNIYISFIRCIFFHNHSLYKNNGHILYYDILGRGWWRDPVTIKKGGGGGEVFSDTCGLTRVVNWTARGGSGGVRSFIIL